MSSYSLKELYAALFKSGADDLFRRSVHVPNEDIKPIGQYDYHPVVIAIQQHDAQRRGQHYDLRIGLPDRSISFVIPYSSFPQQKGKGVGWIRMPDHVAEYANLARGTIPQGEYGAGRFHRVSKYSGTLKTHKDGSFDLFYYDKDKNYRRMHIKPPKQGTNVHYAFPRSVPEERYWQQRKKYKDLKDPGEADLSPYIASEKLDGAMVYAKITDKGITLTSRHKGKRGELHKEHHVPWVRDVRVPKRYHGMVLSGELVHPNGFMNAAAILNSLPDRAVAKQELIGRLRFYPHDVVGQQGMTYEEKLKLLENFVQDAKNDYIRMPRYSHDARKLLKKIQSEGGEGVVLAKPTDTDADPFQRVKLWESYIGEVVGYEKGSGKFKDGIGSLLVRDQHGRTVHVGSGKNMDHALRREILRNWNKYKGSKVRVLARGATENSLRQPLWGGFALEEQPLDVFGMPSDTVLK